ncbi:MAG: class I SAM-dependent methyltransferase [Desulfomonile tiedjei]|nr:class I SAM-dependent methyltransferase [Desulfomonile tiedjei]
MMPGILRRWGAALARRFFTKLPEVEIRSLLVQAAKDRSESLTPKEGLKFLLELDASLYPLEGWLAVAYGRGTHTKHRHTRYHDFFVNRIGKGERVLDVGCGIGALAFDVAEKAGAEVVGVDLSSDNIRTAVQKYSHPAVSYLVGDVLQIPLKGKFDAVILSNVVEHLEARAKFLRGAIREIRPERVLLRVPVFERDWRVPLKQELGIDWRLDSTHCTEYTLESFAAEMEEADLKVTHQEVRWGEIWAEAVPI